MTAHSPPTIIPLTLRLWMLTGERSSVHQFIAFTIIVSLINLCRKIWKWLGVLQSTIFFQVWWNIHFQYLIAACATLSMCSFSSARPPLEECTASQTPRTSHWVPTFKQSCYSMLCWWGHPECISSKAGVWPSASIFLTFHSSRSSTSFSTLPSTTNPEVQYTCLQICGNNHSNFLFCS